MKYINIHTHSKSSTHNQISIQSFLVKEFTSETTEKQLSSIGIHPWHINETHLENDLMLLEKYVTIPNVIAIGECGLDRFFTKDEKQFQQQLKVFNHHAEIASKQAKPLILHSVNAFSDFLHWLKNNKNSNCLIFHGFNGNEEISNQLLKYNCWFSYGDSLFNSPKNQENFKNIPLERCFLETDESTIPIEAIYEQAAKLKNMDIEKLKEKIVQNFIQCFNSKEYL